MAAVDDILAAATRRSQVVPLCMRGDLAQRHEQLVEDLDRALSTGADDDELERLAGDIQQAEDDLRAATVDWTFAGVGRKAWSDLVASHPPTREQVEMFGIRLRWNPDTFPAAAIAASCVAPEGVTVEHVQALEEATTEAEWTDVWNAVLTVNLEGRRPGESSAASAILRRLRPSSEPPETTEPLAASSSGAA
jgi:hypothetical protein